jgi:hypothetical protein
MLIVAFVFVFQQLAAGETLCPSVCWCPIATRQICLDQFIHNLDMGREKYAQGLKEIDVNGQTVSELDSDSISRWNGPSQEYLNKSSFNIVNITKNTFMSLVHAWYLNLSANKITAIHPDTFQYNRNL